eukprot:1161803-Pelagomonas_calceolata.AAC.9
MHAQEKYPGEAYPGTTASVFPYLQAQCLGNAVSIHQLATHDKALATGSNALAAQLRESIHCALAHAHVVGRDVSSQAFQSSSAGGRSRSSRGGVAGGGRRLHTRAGGGRWAAGGAGLHQHESKQH